MTELYVRALFVDYAKAFDHVDHGTVLRKLRTYGVPDCIINWLFAATSAKS